MKTIHAYSVCCHVPDVQVWNCRVLAVLRVLHSLIIIPNVEHAVLVNNCVVKVW